MIVKAIYLPDKKYDFYNSSLKAGTTYNVEIRNKRSIYIHINRDQLNDDYTRFRSWITDRTFSKIFFKIIPDNINNIKLL
jgi:hypothetical protein